MTRTEGNNTNLWFSTAVSSSATEREGGGGGGGVVQNSQQQSPNHANVSPTPSPKAVLSRAHRVRVTRPLVG